MAFAVNLRVTETPFAEATERKVTCLRSICSQRSCSAMSARRSQNQKYLQTCRPSVKLLLIHWLVVMSVIISFLKYLSNCSLSSAKVLADDFNSDVT